jgi:hypothetical protein
MRAQLNITMNTTTDQLLVQGIFHHFVEATAYLFTRGGFNLHRRGINFIPRKDGERWRTREMDAAPGEMPPPWTSLEVQRALYRLRKVLEVLRAAAARRRRGRARR